MTPPSVIDLDRIKSVLPEIDLLTEMKAGFIAYSRGECIIPPVGELIIDEAIHGEVHIKYGYARGGRHYVVKIASGFPGNSNRGISTSNGMMLLFDLRPVNYVRPFSTKVTSPMFEPRLQVLLHP